MSLDDVVECEGPSLRGVPCLVILLGHILHGRFVNEAHEQCTDEVLKGPVGNYSIWAFDLLVKPLGRQVL